MPGHFSIATPGNGYAWKEIVSDKVDGISFSVWACTKESSTSGMTLTVQELKADSDGKRIATLKGHFNALVNTSQQKKFKILKVKQPSLATPIPDQVDYSVSSLKPSGAPAFFRCTTIFRNNTYLFQAIAGSEEEVNKLFKTIESLKELSN